MKQLRRKDLLSYENDGVVCLRGALPSEWIELLADAVEDVLADPGPRASNDESRGGRYAYDTFMWTRHETFRRLHQGSPLPELAAQLMRSRTAYLMVDSIFVKEPGTPTPTPWHQDQPVGWYDGHQLCSMWIPLDPVTIDSGALEYVRGSHRSGTWYASPAEAARGKSRSGFAPLPDIEADRDGLDIIHFEMLPGDVLVHHLLALHGSPGNLASDRRRRAIALRYGGDDATYAVRPTGLKPIRDPQLSPGDPFGCDLFPRVWPRTAAE